MTTLLGGLRGKYSNSGTGMRDAGPQPAGGGIFRYSSAVTSVTLYPDSNLT
jgi:hypothetical protein